MSDSEETTHEIPLVDLLETLLFVAPGPVHTAQLATALDRSTAEVEVGLMELEQLLCQRLSLRILRHAGKVSLVSAPEVAGYIERFLGLEAASRLSKAGLETLAIVAYQQPVTRPHVDSIRGVNSDAVMKSLLGKGLIQELGRAEAPGRPILYGTTEEFLQYFGLPSIQALPELEPVEVFQAPNGNNNGILKD
jgi:segregation and condensation protein B